MRDKKNIRKIIEREYPNPMYISRVSNSAYKIENKQKNEVWYAKKISKQKYPLVEKLVAINSEIGMPKSRMIDGEINIQLMRPAEGQQLSKALLWHLFPPVWSIKRKQIMCAFKRLGKYLGTLHDQTQTDSCGIVIDNLHLDKYDAVVENSFDSVLHSILDKEIVSILENNLDKYSDSEQPCSIVHGDMMLFHVYISGVDVSMIDFDRAKYAHPVEDIATFQSALDLFIRRLPYARQAQFNQLISAFNKGYNFAASEWQIDLEYVSFFRALRHCSILCYYLNKIDDESLLKLRILKRYDIPKLKRAISESVNEIT